MNRELGPVIAAIGVAVVVIGLLVWSGALSWMGRLPGDLRFEGERSRVYVPLASGIIVSIVLTVLLNLFMRWWR